MTPQEQWSDKRERQYEHIKDGLEDRGRSEDEAKEIAARIEATLDLADRIGLVGTPSFVAGDQAIFGYLSREDLAALVADSGGGWCAPMGDLSAMAALIGGLQKGIEVMNPANTLAAQTWMILLIIIFIQFRPRGIMPTRGRAAEA